MKLAIAVVLSSVTTLAVANVTSNQAHWVFNSLKQQAHIGHPVSLHIVHTRKFVAYSMTYDVVLSTGALHRFRNNNELAIVLGHELSHIYLRHTESGVQSKHHELAADGYGKVLAHKAGYNICNGIKLLRHMGKYRNDGVHPSNRYRYHKLAGGC